MDYRSQFDILKAIHNEIASETATITRSHDSLSKRKKVLSDTKQYRLIVEATLKGLLLYLDGAIEKGQKHIHMLERANAEVS